MSLTSFTPLCLGSGAVNSRGTVLWPTANEPAYVTLSVEGTFRWADLPSAIAFLTDGPFITCEHVPAPRIL
jgi:hypothetical protein